MSDQGLNVLVVGCGHMGASHARAYSQMEGFDIVGLVSRGARSREKVAVELSLNCPLYDDFQKALRESDPDVVCISTYPDTHVEYAEAALRAGAHVFIEKPMAETVEESKGLVDLAKELGRELMVGYILRVHPSWTKFIELAQGLGKPLVMRMNLNQQSSGENWQTHRKLMDSMMPIVDCGVHYVDVMSQMTGSRPVTVSAMGARLSDEIPEGQMNYGQLQVRFEDGSVGWYEAGWGPMMSQTAFFVKDVVGPKGSVTIEAVKASGEDASDDVDSHTKTESLRLHHAKLNEQGEFAKEDEWIWTDEEPDHDGLCRAEQELFLQAIRGEINLSQHLQDAVDSLRIVLAAKQSIEEGRMIEL